MNHEGSDIIGVVFAVIPWRKYFSGFLEDEAAGMVIRLENSCQDDTYSFQVEDDDTVYIGKDFVETPKYSHMSETKNLGLYDQNHQDDSDDSSDDRRNRRVLAEADESDDEDEAYDEFGRCQHYLSVHGTQTFVDSWEQNHKIVYPIVVASIFMFTAAVFLIYDIMVSRRQKKVLTEATKTRALVSSLFPQDIQKRMMEEAEREKQAVAEKGMGAFSVSKQRTGSPVPQNSAPIADYFTDVTILFADIVGFTSWSSQREPSQVFLLLETIYSSFDKIAERREVFKVETVVS